MSGGQPGDRGWFDASPAMGGPGAGAGCSGGGGSFAATLDGAPSSCSATSVDGGGGGGGAGRIRINGRSLEVDAGLFSPSLGSPAATTGPLPVR
jgi:hypothetical protein